MLDAGDEGRRDGAEPDEQYAQLPASGRNVMRFSCHEIPRFQDDTPLPGERHQRPVPLRRNPPGARPVLDGALAPAEQVRQCALPAEAADDALSGLNVIDSSIAAEYNDFFVIEANS